ncbi:alpha/beta-hydrolase [Trichoderma citrinoviride]|uniref:Carboxylic ester hydrolase n=1 Tax=Trichoderma citrinoviride TaxID=58853 RepID=A0A2T4AZ42_9HYPO|nr:alpha/beta-hydrolase [Trichoderma citrinoviride]PTB62248.1 alpha/beta-hydrolase [Trichoderma citrinoviride]
MIRIISLVLALASTTNQALATPAPGPRVDLGYAVYEGLYNATLDLNIWKSIRYAAPPVGNLRWQAPQEPPQATTPNRLVSAVDQPPWCPQSGAYGVPSVYGFNSGPGDEDCLYLNVYAPPQAENLPVLVWIHGGGYSVFGATYDPRALIKTNNNSFITVEIQYRLGAFGQLASPDVQRHGRLNAGLLDQRFALQWVQKHIASFGGDPRRVTVGGESSGAASAMYQALAYGGREAGLFSGIILASTYVPPIYPFDHDVPTGHYHAFAEAAGCGSSFALSNHSSVFDCLVAADTTILQYASGLVSTSRGYFGSFAWLPVIDHHFIQHRPSAQLGCGKVSGKHLLIGTNADEGVPLTNPNITTKSAFDAFISSTLPHLTSADVFALNRIYDTAAAQPGDNGTRFDTPGDDPGGPTANAVSGMATGIQQTAFNVAAESTFHCPSQWLAEAFSAADSLGRRHRRRAWKYQYSLDPAYHGADLGAYFALADDDDDDDGPPSRGFRHSFRRIWGEFIVSNNPVISVSDAKAGNANATVPIDDDNDSSSNPEDSTIAWPAFSAQDQTFLNLNTTGGEVQLVTVTEELSYYVRGGEGVVNEFRLADGRSWEGGRGQRCEFWRAVAPRVPF